MYLPLQRYAISSALGQGSVASFFGREGDEPILVRGSTYIEAVAEESYPLFILLRHRTVSSPICLSEAIRKPFALSRILLLSSGGKSVLLVKGKAPSRSGILLSMHVDLKTRHVNPNIHVRRY